MPETPEIFELGDMRRVRRLLGLCVLACMLAGSARASANGRFPRAEKLIEDPRDPAHLILGATYGLLVTYDAGASWRHVCEAAFAEAGLQTDPLLALAPDGALLAGIYASIARSSGDPCDFEKTLGMGNFEAVPDFTLVQERATALLVTLQLGGTPPQRSSVQLYDSTDAGQSWSAVGRPLPDLLREALTVDVAASDSARVYVSGVGPDGAGVLLRSDDGGQTFLSFALPTNAALGEAPYIAALDPHNADALYVRTDVWDYDPEQGVAKARDALLYSDDAGESFRELFRAAAKLYGFTFSPDGSEVLLGYGDPVEAGGGRETEVDARGIYRGANGSDAFTKRYAGAIGCLTWTEQGLYGCTLEAETGFSLGLAADTDFDLDTPQVFAPLLRLDDVVGPVECAACSAGSVCPSYWESTCQSWGREDCVSLLPAQEPVCAEAGATGSGGEAASPAGGGGGPSPLPASPGNAAGGCDCQTARGSSLTPLLLLLALGYLRRFRGARSTTGALRSADSPSCRTQTALALHVPRRHDQA